MRETTTTPDTLESKLKQLDALLDTFEHEERKPVECYFVGALSVLVCQEIWTEALESAATCAAKYGNKKKRQFEEEVVRG